MEKIKIKYLADIEPLQPIVNGDWIDLKVAEDTVIEWGEYKQIRLGVAMQLPEGYEALVAPRSSTFKKYGLIMTNSIGIIDESYCGDNDEWSFPAVCLKGNTDGGKRTVLKKNDRICQFRIIKHQPEIEFKTVDSLGNTDRGGFGSTGK